MGRGEEPIPPPPNATAALFPTVAFPRSLPMSARQELSPSSLVLSTSLLFLVCPRKKRDVFSLSLPRQTNGETSFRFPPPPPFSPRAAERDSFLSPPPPSPLAPTLWAGRVWEGGGEKERRAVQKSVICLPSSPFVAVPPAPTLRRGGGKEGGLDRRVVRKESGEKPTS